jgi:hypothetical protein
MRLGAMTRVGLKSPNSLSHDIPSVLRRTVNVSEGVPGVSISEECVRVGVLPMAGSGRSDSMRFLVSRQSFPHLWKKLWKSTRTAFFLVFIA